MVKMIYKYYYYVFIYLFIYRLCINFLLQVVRDKVKKFAQLAASGVRPE